MQEPLRNRIDKKRSFYWDCSLVQNTIISIDRLIPLNPDLDRREKCVLEKCSSVVIVGKEFIGYECDSSTCIASARPYVHTPALGKIYYLHSLYTCIFIKDPTSLYCSVLFIRAFKIIRAMKSGLINLTFIKQNLMLQSLHILLDLLDDLSLVKNEKQNLELGQKSSPMFTSRILEKTWMMSALRISLASLDLP